MSCLYIATLFFYILLVNNENNKWNNNKIYFIAGKCFQWCRKFIDLMLNETINPTLKIPIKAQEQYWGHKNINYKNINCVALVAGATKREQHQSCYYQRLGSIPKPFSSLPSNRKLDTQCLSFEIVIWIATEFYT